MQSKLSLTTPAHIFAASPTIRKDVVDKLKVRRVETNEYTFRIGGGRLQIITPRGEPVGEVPLTSKISSTLLWGHTRRRQKMTFSRTLSPPNCNTVIRPLPFSHPKCEV